MNDKVLNNSKVSWAYSYWCLGCTLLQIAEALNVNEKTIRREFKQRGLVRIRPVLKYTGGIR